ncbi:hypothetical protein N5P37_010935 [Trichoderma harzianum]|nr:hypothetical protein N5P37_010935 [Trichoderma harzianum]
MTPSNAFIRLNFDLRALKVGVSNLKSRIQGQGTKCLVDEVTHSKRNPDQVFNALKFLADMVKTTRISAADIAIITPYAANVELINRRRTRPELEVLSAMPPAATVDSFQGREADIRVIIMGTTEEVGPGFTTDQNRLNVMFSRQKSSLLVFGYMYVMGRPDYIAYRQNDIFTGDPRLPKELKAAEAKIGLQAQMELLQLVKSSLSVTKALWETFPVGPEDADTQRWFEVDRTASIARAGKLTGVENPNVDSEGCEADKTFEDSEEEPESDVEFDDLEEGLLDNESDAEDLPADESALAR